MDIPMLESMEGWDVHEKFRGGAREKRGYLGRDKFEITMTHSGVQGRGGAEQGGHCLMQNEIYSHGT